MIRMSPQPDTGEVLAGLVKRVTYHNDAMSRLKCLETAADRPSSICSM
jgi:hypothetical protein